MQYLQPTNGLVSTQSGLSPHPWLVPSDDFFQSFLARPELAPVAESCAAELAPYAALSRTPTKLVTPVQLLALKDQDARESYTLFLRFRDGLRSAGTLEAKEQKIDALHHAPKRLSGYANGVLSGSLKSWVNPFFIWSPSCPKESESKLTSAPPSPSHPRATPPRHHTAKKFAWNAAHPPAAKRTPASALKKAVDACQLRLAHTKRLSKPLFAFCGFKSLKAACF